MPIPNSPKSLAIIALVLAALPFGARSVIAQDRLVDEIKIGVLNHDTDNLWSGFRRESGVDANFEVILTPALKFLGGEVRPALGGSINSAGDTSKAYAAARWEVEPVKDVFFAAGFGGAVHTGKLSLERNDRKALGSRLLFYFPFEIGYRVDPNYSVSIFFDHVSNAWLADPNEGMDTLGIRLGYKFN